MRANRKTALLWVLSALSLGGAACSSADPGDKICDYTTKCNDDGSALLTCIDGRETTTTCTCKAGKCEDNPTPSETDCNFTGSKCNENGSKLLTCTNGRLSEQACTCKEDKCTSEPVSECDWSTPTCSDDGKQLLTCTDGKISPRSCNCKNGACETDPECNWTGSRCNSDGDALITCEGNRITGSQYCTCVDNACEECDYDGKRCSGDAKFVMTCDKKSGEENEVEQCIGLCRDGACAAVPCPESESKSCLDAGTRIYCSNGVMTKGSCESHQICADGECVNRESEVSCDFEKRCIDDNTGYQECINGAVKYTPCDNGYYCNAENGDISCMKAETCENFRAYCLTEDGKEYAMMCSDNASASSVPFKKHCNGICLNGACTSNKTYGASCNPEGQWTHDICIGDDIARCIKRSSGNYEVVKPYDEDCAAAGQICGIVENDGVYDPACYAPCTNYGQIVQECVDISGTKYVQQWKCDFIDADLGDRRLGYVTVEGSYKSCDIDCKNGVCIDYTTLTPDAGTPCDASAFEPRCDSERHAVTCSAQTTYDDSGNSTSKDIVTVEYCDYDERCHKSGEGTSAHVSCRDACAAGDADKYVCESFMTKDASMKYTCQAYGDSYVYLYAGKEINEYMDICNNGCNAATGKCNSNK